MLFGGIWEILPSHWIQIQNLFSVSIVILTNFGVWNGISVRLKLTDRNHFSYFDRKQINMRNCDLDIENWKKVRRKRGSNFMSVKVEPLKKVSLAVSLSYIPLPFSGPRISYLVLGLSFFSCLYYQEGNALFCP